VGRLFKVVLDSAISTSAHIIERIFVILNTHLIHQYHDYVREISVHDDFIGK